MQLHDLESAMKPNFVWKMHQTKLMQVNADIELSADLGIIVFIGMSEMYGFEFNEVMEYLGIEEKEYWRHLKTYRNKMEVVADRMQRGEELQFDLSERVWTKTRLVQNCLNISGTSLIDLYDLPNI